MIALINSDARYLPLADQSVHCAITSPPYYGLRDYGTARWEGGDPACDHKHGRFERGGLSTKQASNVGSGGDEARGKCPKCGAVRIDNQIGLEPTPDCGAYGLLRLRQDLTDEQRDYVIGELKRRGIIR